jgi:hypothetical protein
VKWDFLLFSLLHRKKKVNYNKKQKGNEKKKTNGFPIRHREQRTLTPPVADNK